MQCPLCGDARCTRGGRDTVGLDLITSRTRPPMNPTITNNVYIAVSFCIIFAYTWYYLLR